MKRVETVMAEVKLKALLLWIHLHKLDLNYFMNLQGNMSIQFSPIIDAYYFFQKLMASLNILLWTIF
jgi:hypothetical protein